MYIIRSDGLYTRELIMRQGPVSQKSQNILGLFWVLQFPLYLCYAAVLSHQTLQSSWFSYIKNISFSKQADCNLTNGFSGPEKSSGLSRNSPLI